MQLDTLHSANGAAAGAASSSFLWQQWGCHQLGSPPDQSAWVHLPSPVFFPAEIVVATRYHFNEFLFCINEPETLLLTTKKTWSPDAYWANARGKTIRQSTPRWAAPPHLSPPSLSLSAFLPYWPCLQFLYLYYPVSSNPRASCGYRALEM